MDDELINTITNNGKNEDAVSYCLLLELNEDNVSSNKVYKWLIDFNIVDDKFVKLAKTYEENNYDSSFATYMYQTARFLKYQFLSDREIHSNMDLDHPVPFISYIIHETDDWDDDYERYVTTFFNRYQKEAENEKGLTR